MSVEQDVNTVWILSVEESYEGGDPLGVFSSESEAIKAKNDPRMNARYCRKSIDSFTIMKMDLNPTIEQMLSR
jgi:hypothetical protein